MIICLMLFAFCICFTSKYFTIIFEKKIMSDMEKIRQGEIEGKGQS